MTDSAKAPYLDHYTSLPILLDILSNRRITLVNPSRWEDRNDSYFIKCYKEQKKLKTVLALCFSTRAETYHHWKIYSPGLSGVCIRFNRQALLERLDSAKGFRYRKVIYRFLKEVKVKAPSVRLWPFLKRKPFRDEGEFRIIYESKRCDADTKSIEIDLPWIDKITLSPWLPDTVAATVVATIKSVAGCEDIAAEISRSSLIETESWKKAIKVALQPEMLQ